MIEMPTNPRTTTPFLRVNTNLRDFSELTKNSRFRCTVNYLTKVCISLPLNLIVLLLGDPEKSLFASDCQRLLS